jgi:hypothetical protein
MGTSSLPIEELAGGHAHEHDARARVAQPMPRTSRIEVLPRVRIGVGRKLLLHGCRQLGAGRGRWLGSFFPVAGCDC